MTVWIDQDIGLDQEKSGSGIVVEVCRDTYALQISMVHFLAMYIY